jgi:hypothetical protein
MEIGPENVSKCGFVTATAPMNVRLLTRGLLDYQTSDDGRVLQI